MAILGKIPEIDISVCVDKVALREYPAKTIEVKPEAVEAYQASVTVDSYVEAVTGQEFSVRWSIKSLTNINCPALGFDVFIDGVLTKSEFALKEQFQTAKGINSFVVGVEEERTALAQISTLQKFMFTDIKTSSANEYIKNVVVDKKTMEKTGVIAVLVYRQTRPILQGTEAAVKQLKLTQLPPVVHEKALKGEGKTHGVSLGAREGIMSHRFYDLEDLDDIDHPIAIYRFFYRSRAALQSLCIIPREAEVDHVALAVPELVASIKSENCRSTSMAMLTLEQRGIIEQQVLGFMSANSLVKRQGDTDNASNANSTNSQTAAATNIKNEAGTIGAIRGIKRERVEPSTSSRPYRRQKIDEYKIIDLTEDDDGVSADRSDILR